MPEKLELSECFVCGLPLTSDDYKNDNAEQTGAHLKCFYQWNDAQDCKLLGEYGEAKEEKEN